MTHVVVTGGGGFLGSHLCEQLLRDDNDVTCIDDFSTGRMHNLSAMRLHPRFRIVQHDITEPIPRQLSNVQQIYNLACPASPAQYQADPIRTIRINIIGALHVLDFAQRNQARVLQASTSEVYGDPTVHPQPEHYCGNVRTIGIRACYDEGKRSAETLFFDYHRQHGTSIKVARIFNTYGPRMHPDDERVVTTFLRQSLTGSPLTVHGSGTQTRSFCYVDDTIAAMLLLMNSPPDVTGPINIGNPEETTVLELARAINSLSGERSSIRFLPAQEDDPRQRCPDIGLAAALLGWRPTVALADGLVRTRSHVAEMLETGGRGSVNTRSASRPDPGPSGARGEADPGRAWPGRLGPRRPNRVNSGESAVLSETRSESTGRPTKKVEMDSSEPPVTVLTVTRRVDYLARCVQSVRDQTYRGRVRHLLVIDDNPKALEALHEMGVPATDIVYEKRAPGDEDGPGRLAALRNMAVATAGDTWLAFIDDDNVWEPDHLGSLWSTIVGTGADMAHSQRKIFEADGRPYLREEFPWGRDALTRRAIYAYCLVAGIMSPGSNLMRDRLEMRFTWVDLGEWLFPPRFLNANPFGTAYGAWEWFNISVEDRELPSAVFNSGLKVAATGKPTLHYFMGGYTNSVEGDRVFWRDPADGIPPGWTADA